MKVAPHFIGRAIFDGQIASLNLIGEKKVTNIQSSRTLAGTLSAVRLEQDRTLVVLIQNILLDIVSLMLHKKLGPQNHDRRVIGAYQLGIGAALGVQLLLP